jgi:hypothetical protein
MPRTPKELVSESHLPGILLASEEECARWIESGVLPVAEYRTVRRRGRLHKVRLFDARELVALADLVPSWRKAERRDAGGRGSRDRRGPEAPGGGRRERIADAAGERLGIAVAPVPARRRDPGPDEAPERGGSGAGYRAVVPVELDLTPGPATPAAVEILLAEPLEVSVIVREARRFSQADADEAGGILAAAIMDRRNAAAEACGRAAEAWREELDTYLSAYEGEDRAAILQGIRAGLSRLGPLRVGDRDDASAAGFALRAALDELRARAASRRLRHLREAQVREASGYERYAAIFPLARQLGREILFLAGPTNSGKTHEALRLAANAPSAEILSPLRLLALEHYERLARRGSPPAWSPARSGWCPRARPTSPAPSRPWTSAAPSTSA